MDEIYQKMLNEKLDYTSIYKGGVDAGFNQGKALGISQGKALGISQGISEGKNSEKRIIAKNMLEENVDVSLISKCTNLSIKEINALK